MEREIDGLEDFGTIDDGLSERERNGHIGVRHTRAHWTDSKGGGQKGDGTVFVFVG